MRSTTLVLLRAAFVLDSWVLLALISPTSRLTLHTGQPTLVFGALASLSESGSMIRGALKSSECEYCDGSFC